jgi:hypothetical protein
VYTNAALIDGVLERLADVRPPAPDRPQLAKTVSTPIGTPEEQAVDGWRRFGIRRLASMSARQRIVEAPSPILAIVDERASNLQRPLLGVTTDGTVRTGLRSLGGPKVDTRPIADAASAFLQALNHDQRTQATFPMDATEWRMWINVHMNHFRHGVILEDLTQPVRDLALDIVRATMSARGYHQARSIMRVNEFVAELSGDYDAFGEWPYFVSIFGSPDSGEPWGWQFDGHHVCVNTVVFDDRIVMTRRSWVPSRGASASDRSPDCRCSIPRNNSGSTSSVRSRLLSANGRSSTRRCIPTRSHRACRTRSTAECRPARSTTTSSRRRKAYREPT